MPPCTLASYRRRSQSESSQWASVPFDMQGASLHHSTSLIPQPVALSVLDSWWLTFLAVYILTSVRRGIFWKKPSVLLCGRRCIYWRGQRGRCCTHAVFVFSPENIWDLHRASQRNPSIAFPLVPLPPLRTCKAASHLHQNEELREQNVFPVLLAEDGPFSYLWSIILWSVMI